MDKVNTPVPAEPRSAEEFWPEWQKRNSDIGVLHYWVRDFAEAYAATLREQLATAERENKRLKLKTWTQYKAEKVNELEAALLSAQKEIKELKKRLGEE
jgi:hypothetical protein